MAFVNKKVRLGDVMMDEGVITLDQLNQALTRQQETKHKLGETLVELGFASERQIATALSRQLGLDLVDPNRVNIKENILNLIKDHNVLKKNLVIPFDFDEYDSRYLKGAMADPMDIKVIDDMTLLTGMQISPCIATTTDILAESAGTKLPIWASSTMSAVCRIYVDLPDIFGPVIIAIRSAFLSIYVSFGTNISFSSISSTTG